MSSAQSPGGVEAPSGPLRRRKPGWTRHGQGPLPRPAGAWPHPAPPGRVVLVGDVWELRVSGRGQACGPPPCTPPSLPSPTPRGEGLKRPLSPGHTQRAARRGHRDSGGPAEMTFLVYCICQAPGFPRLGAEGKGQAPKGWQGGEGQGRGARGGHRPHRAEGPACPTRTPRGAGDAAPAGSGATHTPAPAPPGLCARASVSPPLSSRVAVPCCPRPRGIRASGFPAVPSCAGPTACVPFPDGNR